MPRVVEFIDKRTGELWFVGEEVSREKPCPICGDRHREQSWCLVDRQHGLVICPRTESDRRVKDAGWLHKIDAVGGAPIQLTPRPRPKPIVDAAALHRQYRDSATPEIIAEHAGILGVSERSLSVLGAGWCGWALTFPMYDSQENVIGIRKRTKDGKKFSETGTRTGIFIPMEIPDKLVLICEGPTDTAAMLTLGFFAIGRPSESAGNDLISGWLHRMPFKPTIAVVADRSSRGVDCARVLVNRLASEKHDVRLVKPHGHKDVRQWCQDGLSRNGMSFLISSAKSAKTG